MRNLIENVELLHSNSVNFIESVETRNIFSISLDHIDDIVFSGIALNQNICVVDSIFFKNGLNCLVADSVCVNHARNGDTSLILAFEVNFRGNFV